MTSIGSKKRSPLAGEAHVNGQGFPLPVDVPYQGEWIWQDTLFLYRRKDGMAPASRDGDPATVIVRRADGSLWIGVCVDDLAAKMLLPVAEVVACNRAGLLYLRTFLRTVEQRSSFRFRIGEHVAYVAVDHSASE